jgi:predicted nucleic acid-binding protein
MTLLVDSSVLIDFLRDTRGRREYVGQIRGRSVVLATSVVSVSEVYSGLRAQEQRLADELFSILEVVDLDFETARLGGELRHSWARKGITLGLPDCLIAATAIRRGMPLMTDNQKHFPMPELTLHSLPRVT